VVRPAPRFTGSINIFGCKLKGATWGKSFKRPKLVVYSRKKNPKVKTATFGKRAIETETQGTLTPHTGKGLRIGDSLKKLKRLYPQAEGVQSDLGKQWTLVSTKKGTLTANTKNGHVKTIGSTAANIC
jgi:hypothetical protein